MADEDLSTLTAETRRIWDANATFWDERMGEGNDFHLQLIGPATERLLAIRPGEQVLEIACGNGQFARRLVALGARVTATDFSAVFLERARARGGDDGGRLSYLQVDATDEARLLALGTRRFDALVCNMALMDMTTVDPLLRAAAHLLAPGGRFVFSVMHPCFNSMGTVLTAEEEDRDGTLVTTYAVKVKRYRTASRDRGLGIVGQHEPHYYFHRSLTELFGEAFRAGLVLDGLEEPVFAPDLPANRTLSWANFRDIPPALVARLRVAG